MMSSFKDRGNQYILVGQDSAFAISINNYQFDYIGSDSEFEPLTPEMEGKCVWPTSPPRPLFLG